MKNNLESFIARLRSQIGSLPEGDEREAALSAELTASLAELKAQREKPVPVVGPFSGLTRSELARSGTCETDWF